MAKTIQIFGFPCYLSAEEVTKFLEQFTGAGTIFELRIKQSKRPKAFAIVQFTTTDTADLMVSIVNQRLYYGLCELKARKMERDMIPKPRTPMLTLEAAAIDFGCQTSETSFCVFEKVAQVVVKFGFGLRRVEFLLTYCDVEYKLVLSYDSIWQIHERRSWSDDTKYLVIQLLAAPWIYKKSSENPLNDSSLCYLNYMREDQWIRTTDFTASSCIGQCSAVCLELQQNLNLHRVRECFHYYKENCSFFLPEYGTTYSRNLLLGPTVSPPDELELPYGILFKMCSLVQNGCLSGPTLDATFFKLIHPQFVSINLVECALEKLYHLKDCCYEPVKWLKEQYVKISRAKMSCKRPSISLDEGLVYVRRVQVTPTKVYFCGPEVNVSNRVLRKFNEAIDNFIRISFVDEGGEKMRSTDLSTRTLTRTGRRHTELYDRILSTLKNGMVIGNKKYDFLAFSTSQLRENSVWMFAPKDGLTATRIREWMGDFHMIRNVAKYSARLGQSFGSSTETLPVSSNEIEEIPDVERQCEGNNYKYVFSDGIGKISSEFATKVARKCGVTGSTPSAFQIRYAGYKGVVAVDPKSGMKLSLRKSMLKFPSNNTKLDVLSWSKIHPCFLNRQIITLLSTLGVKDCVFEKKQREALNQLDTMLSDPLKAYEALEIMSSKESVVVLKEMILCGYKPDAEPFLAMLLQTFRGVKLLEMRNKSRIFVSRGRTMMGCLDETRSLEYGEVFVQVSGINHKSSDQNVTFKKFSNGSIIQGTVVVAKNPCLHPGDVCVLRAVNVPALHHMVDCVVFPQKGFRPHPNECSGSDLDGDLYFVSWDPELIPPRQIPPMDYSPAPSAVLDRDVKIEEVQEYFTNYILNDSLGIIANAHTAFADKEEKMAESEKCIELAKLFSVAVDFPKTGVPAVIPPELHVQQYPDFMEKLDKHTYESKRVIGKLFREVKDYAPKMTNYVTSFTREVAMQSYDPDMEFDGFENYLDDAYYYKGEYDFKLGNLMDYYEIKTEAEIICGCIMKLKRSYNSRKDVEAIGCAVKSLKKEARGWFDEKSSTSETQVDDVYAKASAWYRVTYHPDYWGCYNEGMNRNHFLSFPWCVYDKLIHIKRMNGARH